jgi:hypothetical protein
MTFAREPTGDLHVIVLREGVTRRLIIEGEGGGRAPVVSAEGGATH